MWPTASSLWRTARSIEEGTPEHFFTNPKNERVRQFLSKIVR